MELTRRRPDDARRRLELRDGQLSLPVGALPERELVLQCGQAHLSVREQSLRHDNDQQGHDHHRDCNDVEHSPAVS
jgi:ferric-dicitrate binding protein FerR (iron transport regulator)